MRLLKQITILLLVFVLKSNSSFGQWVLPASANTSIQLSRFEIYIDNAEPAVLKTAGRLLQQDIQTSCGITIPIVYNWNNKAHQIILSSRKNRIQELGALASHPLKSVPDTVWESGFTESFLVAETGILQLLVSGADSRGAAYQVMDMCRELGVSPWYWWADAPIRKMKEPWVSADYFHTDAPKVKYRGIFINDEAPALSGWVHEKMGGFNHRFYEKLFELMLRLKANYLWPAMWGNAFYDDDPKNKLAAEQYAIVIGTSHHEPLMRAHDEWRRYHEGEAWNYETNADSLRRFWEEGLRRASNEKIVTVGMRGDGDEPMSRETATALLERIVRDQRQLIEKVSGEPASNTPQLWALYKEVQDYYDKGMRVPDDITLLLCDDNWGNLRRLPDPKARPRKGGYGIYYHFDYVGGPRNYKWINTNPLPRVWEQMQLAWQFKAREIWIVNVGDIKPMELPISFFIDLAWNPEAIEANQIQDYTHSWAAQQMGGKYAEEIGLLLSAYAKFNSRRKPELLNDETYQLSNGEWDRVMSEWFDLRNRARALSNLLDSIYSDAYFQLVLHPIEASANLNELYYHVAKNKEAYSKRSYTANYHAKLAQVCYQRDSLITVQYHQLNRGKWNHLMSQTHIGYTYWQQPEKQSLPTLQWLAPDTTMLADSFPAHVVPTQTVGKAEASTIYQQVGSVVSIEASRYSRIFPADAARLRVLPDHGRTGSALGIYSPGFFHSTGIRHSPHVEYNYISSSSGSCQITAYFSPTLNLFNQPEGLRFAISIDDELPQIISINKEDTATGRGIWEKWVAENSIRKTSKHAGQKAGQHRIKVWFLNTGLVLQKLELQFGRPEPSYLGAPETFIQHTNPLKP